MIPYQKSLTRDEINVIPVVESNEEFVRVPDHERIIIFPDALAQKYPYARKSVIDKLIEVANVLPQEFSLGIIELYRPVNIQIQKREEKFQQLLKTSREKSEEEIWKLVDSFVARPGGPHQTGGAVDVTLIWREKGETVNMGTDYATSHPASYTNSKLISSEAQSLRSILWSSMTSYGFCNYHAEWWHYEYGTKRWAGIISATHALYDIKIDE